MSMFDQLAKSISELAHAIREQTALLNWFRSHFESATKHDLKEMEKRMAIKLSELNNTVSGMRSQVEKIWGEQQTKYDALVVAFDNLKGQLETMEVPADAEQSIVEFQKRLQEFDDAIPDTTA